MQRKGIGTTLLEFIEKTAKEKGGTVLILGASDENDGGVREYWIVEIDTLSVEVYLMKYLKVDSNNKSKLTNIKIDSLLF